MTQPTPTTAPPALLNITLGVMLALMLGWFFHIASGVLVPMVLGLMISSDNIRLSGLVTPRSQSN